LWKYLDSQNPGDCHINIYWDNKSYENTDPDRHIAPSGKVYDVESNTLWYTSPNFIYTKYFANIEELRKYIDKNNPAIVVWDHKVDVEFEPIIHTAPNGKEYKIYKTDKGYMSYKMLKIQYFKSLEELKKYIDRNNFK
jgi:predicted heme/steroid binding protein